MASSITTSPPLLAAVSDGRHATRYDQNGPRYTSYPTAPQFQEDFSAEEFMTSQSVRLDDIGTPLSLYVHIPFCRDICYYCACNKIVTREADASRTYLDMLRREIKLQAKLHGKNRPVTQMHWGGGTPTYLNSAELTELWHALASHFRLLNQGRREYTIEIDPRSVDASAIALLKGLGFNRVSLGIQDFDPLVQKSINRVQPVAKVRELVGEIRRHGFRSLSFDLIYGLPEQDTYTMEATLQRVIELAPDRIACYNYAHMPNRFLSQRAIDRLTLPSARQKLALQTLISQVLRRAGYLHIGLDHYVLPGDDLAVAQREAKLQRNFQGYSVQLADDIVGLGVSAISQVGDYYVQNERELPQYYGRLEKNQFPIQRGIKLSTDDKLRRHIIMQLICNLGLDFDACNAQFSVDVSQRFSGELAALQDMARDGLLAITGNSIKISEAGRPFLRNICMIFDQYLTQSQCTPDAPKFYSATV